MIKKLILIFCCVAAMAETHSQIFTQVIDEQELNCRIKQIDEFFMRFNYKIDYAGKPVEPQESDSEPDSLRHFKTTASLLNLDKFATGHNSLDSIASEFVDYVINSDVNLHYEDTTWHAMVTCSALYNGKPQSLTLRMQPERVQDEIYKWVISDVFSPLVDCMKDSCNMNLRIFPGAHGGSFITIPEFINLNTSDIHALFCKGYEPTSLAAFEYLIKTGKLKLQNVTGVKYSFHTPEYDFIVEQFSKKNTYNNGWLISTIIKNQKL